MKKFSRANGRHFSLAKVPLLVEDTSKVLQQLFLQAFPSLSFLFFFCLFLPLSACDRHSTIYTSNAVMAYVLSGIAVVDFFWELCTNKQFCPLRLCFQTWQAFKLALQTGTTVSVKNAYNLESGE